MRSMVTGLLLRALIALALALAWAVVGLTALMGAQ